jgi:uncharacterized protein YndB with AHSA1/START domain
MSKNNMTVNREAKTITMSRVFDAPRELVWTVCTSPEYIPEWWGPRRMTTVVDRMDLQVGGAWRYIQTDPKGNEYAFNGVYKAVQAPERLTYTFEFEPMAGHISTETIVFEALPEGRTRVTATTVYGTIGDLEGVLQSGMEGGAVETWDRLEALLKRLETEKY